VEKDRTEDQFIEISEEEDQEAEDEAAFEMLEMVCDGVEAEKHQEHRKQQLAQMNKVMD